MGYEETSLEETHNVWTCGEKPSVAKERPCEGEEEGIK